MAQQVRKGWEIRLVVGLVTVLLGALTGCSPDSPTGGSPLGPSDQGAPGPAGSAVTAVAPTPTWNVRCTAHALPRGWTWYQDARAPFRVAVPPTWRPGAFEFVPDGSGLGAASPTYSYVVDFFGPGSVGQSASNGGKDRFDLFPPVIIIETGAGGILRDPDFRAQPAPICIGSTPVTLYVSTSNNGDVERSAVLSAGPKGYPYSFLAVSRAETAARDSQLFLAVLGTFSPVAAG